MLFRSNDIGAEINLDNLGEELISETPGRVLIALSSEYVSAVTELAHLKNIRVRKLGKTGGNSLKFNDVVISLEELSEAYRSTFQRLFG